MERLLHYTWQHRLYYPAKPLYTTDGRNVEIIDPGLHNTNAGPDYFNAKVKIGEELWVGNVEIHSVSSDWFHHGHDKDDAYNNVILHVVEKADMEVVTADGKQIPQLVLQVPPYVAENYSALLREELFPPCHQYVSQMSLISIHQWLDALCVERLESKTERINLYAEKADGDWEHAFFQVLARSFGFGINGEAFEEWANHISLSVAGKHRDNLFQIEALFLGQAGLLEEDMLVPYHKEEAFKDGYFEKLRHEYQFLAHKFTLQPMNGIHWRFLRLRPQNFPHIRLVQLAVLFHSEHVQLSSILEAKDLEQIHKIFSTHVTSYWETHYGFGSESARATKELTARSLDLIIINAVIPMLFAYGRHSLHEDYCERALDLLTRIKAEDNRFTRIWMQSGLSIQNASDSQAIIQLRTAYCDRKDCLRCRIGYEYIKNTKVYRSNDFLREGTADDWVQKPQDKQQNQKN